MGIESSDDAAVYRLDDGDNGGAVVTTLDFFPPIVDDPYLFGSIAAANALSDIYAMGGVPKFALNIVCFPTELPNYVLTEILNGSAHKLNEVGVVVAGGHSVEDEGVKFGLSVTGFIHPDKVITNKGAKDGDLLFLTKPIGSGIITSALKNGSINEEDAMEVLKSMATLNDKASSAMVEASANACTDVTGFGLAGHALEMARGGGLSIEIHSGKVSLFDNVLELVKKTKNRPKSIEENIRFMSGSVIVDSSVSEEVKMLMFDPQTSGGLLIAISPDRAKILEKLLTESKVSFDMIGAFNSSGKSGTVSII